jgi:hypothetical protein
MGACGAQSTTPYVYRAYGITFAVPFACPALAAAAGVMAPDVVVREGPVGRTLDDAVVREDRWEAEPGRFLVRGGRRAGRFLVEEGRVTLDRNPGAEEELLARCFVDAVIPRCFASAGCWCCTPTRR